MRRDAAARLSPHVTQRIEFSYDSIARDLPDVSQLSDTDGS